MKVHSLLIVTILAFFIAVMILVASEASKYFHTALRPILQALGG
jgi:hypothetical protein